MVVEINRFPPSIPITAIIVKIRKQYVKIFNKWPCLSSLLIFNEFKNTNPKLWKIVITKIIPKICHRLDSKGSMKYNAPVIKQNKFKTKDEILKTLTIFIEFKRSVILTI